MSASSNVPGVSGARVARYAEAVCVDLDVEHAYCASHGASGSSWSCACGVVFPDRHGHAAHVLEVQAAAVVAVANAEQDKLRAKAGEWYELYKQANEWSWELHARAETAETDLAALRGRIEAPLRRLASLLEAVESECDLSEDLCHDYDLTDEGACALASDLASIAEDFRAALAVALAEDMTPAAPHAEDGAR